MLEFKSESKVTEVSKVQCFTVSSVPLQVVGFGTSGISPAVVRHIHAENSEGANIAEIAPQVFGTGSISPAVVRHLMGKVN